MMNRLLTIFAVTLFLTSCLTSSKGTEEKRISIYFKVNNIGQDLEIESEIINVREFKFSIDRFNLYATDDVVLQTSSDVTAMIFAYNEQISEERLILDVGLGFSDVDEFTGYEIFMEPVGNQSGIFDSDFFGENENYSLIIKGEINETEFEFNSSLSFEDLYPIDGVELDSRNETLIVQKQISLENVFTSDEGGFLNPNEAEQESLILENIKNHLELTFSAGSFY